jgi:hypothetical protein
MPTLHLYLRQQVDATGVQSAAIMDAMNKLQVAVEATGEPFKGSCATTRPPAPPPAADEASLRADA